jgi:hypothetical protein
VPDLLEGFDLPRIIIHLYAGPPDVLQSMVSRGVYLASGIEFCARLRFSRSLASFLVGSYLPRGTIRVLRSRTRGVPERHP